jgi:hypothetical protein
MTMTTSVKKQVREQIASALKNAVFPVRTTGDLIAAFPDGVNTFYQMGDLKMTVGELALLLKESDFPFRNAKAIADLIIERAGV